MQYGTTMAGLVVSMGWAVIGCAAGGNICNEQNHLALSHSAQGSLPRFLAQAQGYKIDADHWHAEVHHSLPYEQYLRRDAKLRSMLQRIPLPM